MASTLGEANPLRYRGYVYDTETKLYYLQSRYYDPELGRFINADAYTATGQGLLGNNMFAYCGNNPVNFSDPTGNFRVDRVSNPGIALGEKFAEWYINSDENETDKDGNFTHNAKCKQTVRSMANSIEFVFGIGLGMYGGANVIYEFGSIDFGIYADLFRITYIDGEYDICQYGKSGLDFSLFFINVIPAMETYYKSNLSPQSQWIALDDDEVINLVGVSGYFYGGATFELNWDILGLIKDLEVIWG